ncbi:MAG: alpha/beta fold hydrolase [Symploca sp. SIO3C6]|uniref:Alpha/beta fold hydrolase n=1 Tax=Symploca sp. SIO1C4 TaxID=2607765 RepID=A0A6B3NAZ5_9CYAN|nr:alpha/beta fold hydrolase [Symploca sp. SIO3C6]NER27752.1 alpha/beta fold hydrolase [Symploca sp. SIO1C4]NET05974.1 alpha/beta fold hydrolase [Symploca sp. SIO2B6]
MTTQKLRPTSALEKHFWHWQGHQIQYTVMGVGQPLILIHGFGASIGHWRKNIPVLAEAGYQVFAIDLLGFGGSGKPRLNYSLELWQQQLKDFWEIHIAKPTIFAGNSIGALLSLMVVSDYPEISLGGILINCAGGLNHRPHELNLPLRLVMGAFTKLVSSKTLGAFIFENIRKKNRIRRTLTQVYYDPEAITEELVDLLYTPSCDQGAQQVFASVLSAPPGRSPAELLPQVKHPLLVIWGEEDPWTPISGAAIYQQQVKMGKDVEFVAVSKAGHCPHDEKPDIVNQLIIDWLCKYQC